jgi:hypothetical protein
MPTKSLQVQWQKHLMEADVNFKGSPEDKASIHFSIPLVWKMQLVKRLVTDIYYIYTVIISIHL